MTDNVSEAHRPKGVPSFLTVGSGRFARINAMRLNVGANLPSRRHKARRRPRLKPQSPLSSPCDHGRKFVRFLLPELGRMSCKQIAALVGLAPYDFDSGKLGGHRTSTRASVR